MNITQIIAYFIGWSFFRTVYTLIGRLKIRGLYNLPGEKGAIIAANHISLHDPQLVGCSIPRPIHYMAKRELFDIPVLGWLLRQVNSFPVNRAGTDQKAVRTALRLLSKGRIVLMFPQGTRRSDNLDSFQLKEGIGMLSCLAQVPIIPCMVRNSNKLKSLHRLSVTFLKPVFPPEKYDRNSYKVLAESVTHRMKQLFDPGH